jgi:uncharacterized protein (DUF362 family)
LERRDFLKKTGSAVALATVTGTTGLVFHNRETAQRQSVVAKTNSFEVPPDPSLPVMTSALNADPVAALNAALDGIGGIERFVQAGETVVLKPNVGWDRTPEQGANTHPALVSEMVRLCLGGVVLKNWPVLRHFIEADRLINMPVVKQHSLTRCTVGMKNLYGILGGRRNRLHQEIDQSIVDLAAFVRPTLTVVDATRVMIRGGPQGGSLDDVRTENTVMCATDQVAADARSAEFLGLSGRQVGHIALAAQSGLGSLDYRNAGYKEVV